MLAARRMRIAIVTDYYFPQLGGISEHVHGEAWHLTRRGHEVTVVTGRLLHKLPVVDEADSPQRDEPFEVLRLGVGLPLYGNAAQTIHTVPFALTETLRRLFRKRRFDVVHAHAPYSPGIGMLVGPALPKTTVGVATYHSVFSTGPLLDTFSPIIRWSLAKLDAHIVVSEACVGSLAPYFPFPYRVIPNGIDDRHFSPQAEPLEELRGDGKPVILFLGRFDPRNGLGTMLDAFTRVHRELSGTVRLCVVGDGPLGKYYRRQVPPDVEPDIVWAGRVDWTRPRYYVSADIHCTPCNKASFGMVLLEAMSCGRPVVASRISGFQLLMEHGRQGLLVRPADDAERFAHGLLYLLDRPAERARMGREGRRTAVSQYSWTKVSGQLEHLFADLLEHKRIRVAHRR
jgi:phosphatidylinositol alpha-mannosyltransferase